MNINTINSMPFKKWLIRLISLSLLIMSTSVLAAPAVPTLNSPSNGATNVAQANLKFSWSASSGSSVKYRFIYSQNSSFSGYNSSTQSCNSTCYTVTNLTTTSISLNIPLAKYTYYWKVYAFNSTGKSNWSSYRSFKTADVVSFPPVDWNSSAYRSSNIFWQSGYAPKRFYSNGVSTGLGSAKGNCTWYAHGRLRQLGYTNKLNSMTSNAATWNTSAKNAGILVDTTPSAGALAQSTANRSIYKSYGHVAFIEKVNSDGTLLISESSYAPGSTTGWDFEYRTRTVNKSEFNNYIHVTK